MRHLPPNVFAMVMATGIVSLAANGAGWIWPARVLFVLNVGMYAVLWALLLGRCARYGEQVRDDARHHARAPGFFTVVAGTGVLGNQCVLLFDLWQVALGLWVLALVLWVLLTYTILPGLMEATEKPTLEKGINGSWLLVVVATQAVCALGCLVSPHLSEEAREPMLFACLAFWLVGGILYAWLMGIIVYRLLFLPLPPADLAPPYWVSMGAMAISTLAGVFLVRQSSGVALLVELRPFLKGMALLFWATATWWIPLLLALGAWRHVRQGVPLNYETAYWAAVFPLGMYTTASQNLVRVFELPFLEAIPAVSVWVALGAWAVTFAGLVAALARMARPSA